YHLRIGGSRQISAPAHQAGRGCELHSTSTIVETIRRTGDSAYTARPGRHNRCGELVLRCEVGLICYGTRWAGNLAAESHPAVTPANKRIASSCKTGGLR